MRSLQRWKAMTSSPRNRFSFVPFLGDRGSTYAGFLREPFLKGLEPGFSFFFSFSFSQIRPDHHAQVKHRQTTTHQLTPLAPIALLSPLFPSYKSQKRIQNVVPHRSSRPSRRHRHTTSPPRTRQQRSSPRGLFIRCDFAEVGGGFRKGYPQDGGSSG